MLLGKLASSRNVANKPATTVTSGAVTNQQAIARMLEVDVIEARNLLAVDKNVSSDPYAVVVLTDLSGRELKTETFNTKQKKGTLSPNWNESFTFGKWSFSSICAMV